ncbi:MAG: GTP-binding protein, partial [Anaerolineales bacterium]|nr:GTP-binding protein [Anaerolineales bacterium]
MKEYQTGQIRNVALVSHNGAGKTTMVERLLFDTGAITRLGKVQDGTATTDFEEEEVARNSSTSTAIAPIEYAGLKVNLLDTPGYVDFVGEMNAALSVADGALILVESVAGVEVGTEIAWQATLERDLPRIIVINKMNRDNARAARAMASIREN